MGVSKKHAKGRLDKYYHMAKEQGYRARSAFKLIQLNKKYNFLESSKCLIDLCAAPGGWLQVAAKYMPKPSLIIGVDLVPIKPIPGVITLTEDITTTKCRASLKKELKTWKADIFLHDGAPNVGVSWAQDAFTQSELVLSSLKLATEFLMPGGTFVSKVFRSKDYNKLMWVLGKLFGEVEATKPASSRNVSAEIFVVCRDYLAPKKIDERLLDPKYVFKEIDDAPDYEALDERAKRERQGVVLNDLFHPEKRVRHRDGYEEGNYTLHMATPVAEFIRSLDFVSLLARSSALVFEAPKHQDPYYTHVLTTPEIRECAEDLKVLGKKDFKALLKWRHDLRLDLGMDKKAAPAIAPALAEAELTPAAELSVEEMLELEAQKLADAEKKAKKKSRERKAKQLLKLRLGMATPMDIGIEAAAQGDLGETDFCLGAPRDRARGPRERRAAVAGEGSSDSDEAGPSEGAEGTDSEEEGDDGSDEEGERKRSRLERSLDTYYEQYQAKQLEKNPKAMVKQLRDQSKASNAFQEWYGVEYDKKLGLGAGAEGEGDGSDAEGMEGDAAPKRPAQSRATSDSEEDVLLTDSEDEAMPAEKEGGEEHEDASVDQDDEARVEQLLRMRKQLASISPEKEEASLSKRAQLFFENPLFSAMTMGGPKPTTKTPSKKRSARTYHSSSDSSEEGEDAEGAGCPAPKRPARMGTSTTLKSGGKGGRSFETVPVQDIPYAQAAGAEDGMEEEDGEDLRITNAQEYTLAKRMLRPSGRRDVVDESFNRYAFNDEEDELPKWFMDDERRHNKPTLPVTKEAIDIIRARARALDARPIKKIAEAKFRKQMRTARRLEKATKKAEGLNEEEDVPDRAKLTNISKIMGKAKAKQEKKLPKLVVARGANRGVQGRPKGVKGRYKMVDPRMKKELRADKQAAKHGKAKRRK